MTLEYRPISGLTINGKELNWGDDRQTTRKKLGIKYTEDDRVIDLASLSGVDPSQNIDVKRDIYGAMENLFFFHLNYDIAQKLESVEIHKCEAIQVENMVLQFGLDIDDIQKELLKLDPKGGVIESGEFVFPQLKVAIASSEVREDSGSGFSYFYAANSIEHLLE
jgi:hypothetical protein